MLPVFSATRSRERVGDGLGDERLAAARRAVQQDALRRLQLVFVEQVRVEVRQLDGVLDRVDLVVESADVVVGDVGDLFEHELFDLGSRQALDEQPGACVHEQVITGAELHADQRGAELADALLVGPADDDGAVAARQHLLEHDDLTGDVAGARQHDVERLVERDLLASLDVVEVDLGVHRDAHLAPGGEDVDGAVVVGAEVGAVGRRRHRELLDLLAQGGDVLPRLAQGGGEAFVLRHGLRELALRLEEALLERAHPLGCILEAAAQDRDLVVEGLQLPLELANLALVLGELAGHAPMPRPITSGRETSLPRGHYSSPLRVPCHFCDGRMKDAPRSARSGR